MLVCPNCHGRFESRVLICQRCRRELVPLSMLRLVDRASQGQTPTLAELLVCSFHDAQAIEAVLQAKGITCRISRSAEAFEFNLEGSSGLLDQPVFVVAVSEAQAAEAEAIIEAFYDERREPDAPAPGP